MTERSLQVTYRKGKPFSAYLHLSHQTGEKSARTVPSADGLLVVDYGQNGNAIGVEITAPSAVPLDRLNRVLADLRETPLSEMKAIWNVFSTIWMLVAGVVATTVLTSIASIVAVLIAAAGILERQDSRWSEVRNGIRQYGDQIAADAGDKHRVLSHEEFE